MVITSNAAVCMKICAYEVSVSLMAETIYIVLKFTEVYKNECPCIFNLFQNSVWFLHLSENCTNKLNALPFIEMWLAGIMLELAYINV
jgi:hypothetical protein